MNTTEIVNGNVSKVFFKYVLLSILSMLGLSFYVLVDTLFIANGVGSMGLTALNLVLPMYSLVNGVGLMLGIGAATRFSILIGKGRKEHGSKVFTQALYIAVSTSLVLTFMGIFFSDDIAGLLGADRSILPLAGTYLKTIICFSFAFIVNNVILGFVRNDGNPKLAMIAMIAGSISNIILDYIFIFPLQLGMFGAAFATGLSAVLSMCILSAHFIKKKNNFKILLCKFSIIDIGRIFSLGIPSFITEFSSGIIMLVFNFTILKIAGNVGVAAYGIIANLALIAVAIFTGIAQGIQPIISINYGAGKMKNIRKFFSYACILAVALGALFYTTGTLFSENITELFNRDGDIVLTQIASKGINIYFTAFFLMGINIVATSFFSSIAKPKQSFTISMMRGFLAIIPLILMLPRFLGITGVWLIIPLAELITLMVSTLYSVMYFNLTKIKNLTLK